MKEQKKILLADDDFGIRSLYYEIMESYFPAYKIEIFEDGTSLEGRLEKDLEKVGAVITDNEMPGINGSEIIPEYAKKVPMILVYGGAQHIGERAIENGAFAYLLKPVRLEDFTKMLKLVLDDSRK